MYVLFSMHSSPPCHAHDISTSGCRSRARDRPGSDRSSDDQVRLEKCNLQYVSRRHSIAVSLTSRVLLAGLTEYLPGFRRRAGPDGLYRTSDGGVAKNQDLIKYIEALMHRRDRSSRRGVHFVWVKGHAGKVGNERADALANRGALMPAVADRDYAALTAAIMGPIRGPMDGYVARSAAASTSATVATGPEGADAFDGMLASAEELEDEVNGL